MKMSRPLASAVALLASVVLLAGCGGTSEEPKAGADDEAAPSTQVIDDEEDLGPKFIKTHDTPGSVEGFVGARKDATITQCDGDGDVVKVAGTVTNPTDDPQTYRIYVSGLNATETRGVVQIDVPDIAGGATAEWKTRMKLADTDLRCVLRVERFAPEG